MSRGSIPELESIKTEEGDNWSVLVFKCASGRWTRLLTKLFASIDKLQDAKLPHFTLRAFIPSSWIMVSFRVLRESGAKGAIEKHLAEFMREEELEFALNPKPNESFGEYHAWIRLRERNEHWNRNRCEALHKLTRFVIFLAGESMFEAEDRIQFAHLAVNMLGLHEARVEGDFQAYYFDLITSDYDGPFKTYNLPLATQPST